MFGLFDKAATCKTHGADVFPFCGHSHVLLSKAHSVLALLHAVVGLCDEGQVVPNVVYPGPPG